MIQPLRVAHRWTFGVLAVALPVLLFVGLQARHIRPNVPSALKPAPGALVRQSYQLWRKNSIRSEFYRDAQHTYVVLWPSSELGEPDLLLYWVSADPQNNLPAGAHFLGTFAAGKAFELPLGHSADTNSGYLVLYSLGHQSVVDTAALEKLP